MKSGIYMKNSSNSTSEDELDICRKISLPFQMIHMYISLLLHLEVDEGGKDGALKSAGACRCVVATHSTGTCHVAADSTWMWWLRECSAPPPPHPS